jgi:hypothetical protein
MATTKPAPPANGAMRANDEMHALYDALLGDTYAGDMVSLAEAERLGCKYTTEEDGFVSVAIPRSYAAMWAACRLLSERLKLARDPSLSPADGGSSPN